MVVLYIININYLLSDKTLTHLSLASHKWDIDKLCRPWADAAERGVRSGSTLFTLSSDIYTKHGNNKTIGMDLFR